MLEVFKGYGVPAWITDREHFAGFLDLAYGAQFRGEIWLYNNDLEVISDKTLFSELYLDRVFGKHWGKITAVKVLVSPKHQGKVFSADGQIPNADLRARLLELFRTEDGKRKLESIFFAALPAQAGETSVVSTDGYTVVLYLHGESLGNDPSGIVMVRPHIYPFVADERKRKYAVVWQLVDDKQLAERLEPLDNLFRPGTTVPYSHVVVRDNVPRLVRGLPASYTPRGSQGSRSGLLLGQETDYLILASNPEELAALKTAFEPQLARAPVEAETFELAVVSQHGDAIKIVFGLTGEGNTLAAVKASEAILLWRPKEVIFVGMAGGDPADENIAIGDIVVGEQIVRYEIAVVEEVSDPSVPPSNRFLRLLGLRRPRWGHPSSHPGWKYRFRGWHWDASDLKTRAHELKLSWKPQLSEFAWSVLKRDANDIRVVVQPIGSGNKLVLSPRYFKMLQDGVDPRLKAVEMEGDGVGQACHSARHKVRLLMVRGIMDKCHRSNRGTEASRSDVRKAVSDILAQFVLALLRQG